MQCECCLAEETLPFNCAYCRKYFCVDHRLPENHQCSELWRAKRPAESPPPRKPLQYSYTYARSRRSFSSWLGTEETKHLSASAVLVLLVGLSIVSPSFRFASFPIWAIVLSAGLFAISFLLHELSHKFTAQRNGLTSFGAILTVFSIFSPFKIIAPGAVTISGYANESVFGRVAVAGPVTNIMLGILMAIISISIPNEVPFFSNIAVLKLIIVSTSAINGFLAVFNLIPFGILDGRKVFVWNKRVWVMVFGISVALTIFAYSFL